VTVRWLRKALAVASDHGPAPNRDDMGADDARSAFLAESAKTRIRAPL